MFIGVESLHEFLAGNGSVSDEEKLIDPLGFAIRKHIVVRCNSGSISVGPPTHAAGGFVLAAGEQTPPIYIDSTAKVAVHGTGAYSWVAT